MQEVPPDAEDVPARVIGPARGDALLVEQLHESLPGHPGFLLAAAQERQAELFPGLQVRGAALNRSATPGRSAAYGPSGNSCTILNADASRRASLLVAYIHPVCALLPCRRGGASAPRMAHLFPNGPLEPVRQVDLRRSPVG